MKPVSLKSHGMKPVSLNCPDLHKANWEIRGKLDVNPWYELVLFLPHENVMDLLLEVLLWDDPKI